MLQEPSLCVIIRRPDQPGEREKREAVSLWPRIRQENSFGRIVDKGAAVFGQPFSAAKGFR